MKNVVLFSSKSIGNVVFHVSYLEVEVSTESPRAVGASVWLCVRVGVHMECEVVDLMERLITNATLVSFHCTVSQCMVLVVSCNTLKLDQSEFENACKQ